MGIKMNKTCYIFTAYGNIDKLMFKIEDEDFVIAADGGYDLALKAQIKPDLLLGDFDSVVNNDTQNITVLEFSKDKDYTDTQLAISEGLIRGYKNFVIVGGIGGRLDHTIANISLLKLLNNNDADGFMIDNETKVLFLKNCHRIIKKDECKFLSLFSYSPVSEGVSIEGVKFPLINAQISNSFPIGISNEITEQQAKISVQKGELLIILQK
jgi:thiamine pyrophosphokinase